MSRVSSFWWSAVLAVAFASNLAPFAVTAKEVVQLKGSLRTLVLTDEVAPERCMPGFKLAVFKDRIRGTRDQDRQGCWSLSGNDTIVLTWTDPASQKQVLIQIPLTSLNRHRPSTALKHFIA